MNEPLLLNASLYPEELADLGDHVPSQLWMRGSAEILAVRPRVAIVGTRRATSYGLRVTRELAGSVARAGGCVVSGLAAGIDTAAHRAALEAGGATVAILGTGIDLAFTAGNALLQEEIANAGALLSELDREDHGTRFTFPKRNRLIAALCTVVVVVEAPIPSGALGTAEIGEKLGRTVAAVPGPIDQPQSAGSNALIQSGAQMVTSSEDLLALAGLAPPARVSRAAPESDEGKVWSALADGAADMDTLCARSGLPAAQCMAAVTALEIAGSIECVLSGQIRRR
jgi:DNA processing protein